MTPPSRRERAAVALWLIVGAVVWNGLYDILMTRGIKEYLFRYALHESGGGPHVPMSVVMDQAVADAVWTCTLWASTIVLCGMMTIRLMRSRNHASPHPRLESDSPRPAGGRAARR